MKEEKEKKKYRIVWRTTFEGYEYIMRKIFKMRGVKNIPQAERKKWLTAGWKSRLLVLREEQRQMGIPDERFYPTKE